MLTRLHSGVLSGIDALPIDIEVDYRPGDKLIVSIVGLAEGAVRESRERIFSALRHSGFAVPKGVIIINLAPAEVRKEGAQFDLAIAVAVLIASRQISVRSLAKVSLFGELSLDGSLKLVRGAVALTIAAQERGDSHVVLPVPNGPEGAVVEGITTYTASSLIEVVRALTGEAVLAVPARPLPEARRDAGHPFQDVWGQWGAKRALTIAAAGGHNALLIGPPGCGKSMLAERFVSLLPRLSEGEIREVMKVHSAAGLPVTRILSGVRPLRSPHHLMSEAGLVGGGGIPRPGEISLAHRGVLFLDEFLEFRRGVVEALRGPLESGKVTVSRARAQETFPARFQLIAAMNPCPCGRLTLADRSCSCTVAEIHRYLSRLSLPILDRIDLHVDLEPVPVTVLVREHRGADGRESGRDGKIAGEERSTEESTREPNRPVGEGSTTGKRGVWSEEEVAQARDRQLRLRGALNAHLDGSTLKDSLRLSDGGAKLLQRVAERERLSARGFVRVLRVARTIADLEGHDEVAPSELGEALSYRALDRIRRYIDSPMEGGKTGEVTQPVTVNE